MFDNSSLKHENLKVPEQRKCWVCCLFLPLISKCILSHSCKFVNHLHRTLLMLRPSNRPTTLPDGNGHARQVLGAYLHLLRPAAPLTGTAARDWAEGEGWMWLGGQEATTLVHFLTCSLHSLGYDPLIFQVTTSFWCLMPFFSLILSAIYRSDTAVFVLWIN